VSKMRERPPEPDSVLFVAEVVLDRTRPARWVELVLSIPGRDGAFVRRWTLGQGMLDAPSARDLAGCLEQSLMEALTLMCGVQEVLPLS